jgi:hypothetical protein
MDLIDINEAAEKDADQQRQRHPRAQLQVAEARQRQVGEDDRKTAAAGRGTTGAMRVETSGSVIRLEMPSSMMAAPLPRSC